MKFLPFHLLLSLLFLSPTISATERKPISLIPKAQKMLRHGDDFLLPQKLSLRCHDPSLKAVSTQVKNFLQNYSVVIPKANFNIELHLDSKLSAEAYLLQIQPKGIQIHAAKPAGAFYALQSLKQLLYQKNSSAYLPMLSIQDAPRFQWRGMHLDVSRHFYPKAYIKKYIDYLATYKMNTFHWHLVDGPGWRIEIKKYPRLTSIAAWRKDKTKEPWNWRATEINEQGRQEGDYGGFYTQEEIKEIVAYAQKKFVTIVPEIEMPGHSYAVLLAYPEYACPTNEIKTEGLRGKDAFCVGNEGTYTFLQNILDEVLELFPSQYIHIGADEVYKKTWQECPRCQAKKKTLALKDENELQSAFVKRMEKYLNKKGRSLMGWDEILEGGLAPNAAVMVWRDEKFAQEALRQKRPVVMCPGTHCYFDMYQGRPEQEPLAIGGFIPVEKVYSFEPVPKGSTAEEKKLVLGAQGNVWTEYMPTWQHLEYMIFPRFPALAERLWSKKTVRDWDTFRQRLLEHQKAWKEKGIHYRAIEE